MAHPLEIAPADQIPLLLQTKNDEIDEGRKVDHLIEIKETNGQDPLGPQTNKSVNQIFNERFQNLDNSSIESATIFKVTVGLSESNPDAYKPKLISIGPYHKHNRDLGSMENYKLRYLQRFLKRKGEMDVESCISEMDKLKDDALKCYADRRDLDSDNFSQMLLLDGCFVVEYIRENCEMKPKGEDMIIKTGCIKDQVGRDLLLVENQLPFFVLTKLHGMTEEVEISFTKLVFTYLIRTKMTPTSFLEAEGNKKPIKHLLEVVHMLYRPYNNNKQQAQYNPTMCGLDMLCRPSKKKTSLTENPSDKDNKAWNYKVLPNATELSEAGVSFRKVDFDYTYEPSGVGKSSGPDISLFDIKFEDGKMNIPCFKIFDETESLLRNFIAYEQQSCDVSRKYFSDYTTFMDYLIDSDKDVSLFRRKGIIQNEIGEDKEVASLFNKIGRGVKLSDNFYYKEEEKKAYLHCKKLSNRMKAKLMHNYCNSPWVGASTVGAIVLLILTAMQTVLALTGNVKK